MKRHHLPFSLLLIVPLFLLLQMNVRQNQEENELAVITLTAVPGLQFDIVRFSIKPGAQVKVILKNADDMSHNLLFTRPGKRLDVVDAAMKLEEQGPEMNYIPDSPDVLWSIPVLAPGQERSISFTVPKETGVYPYVCTFPGHGFSMFGAMYVTGDGNLPPLQKDPNVPQSRQKESPHDGSTSHSVNDHPYKLQPPYMYRAYMQDSSPASIAVRLNNQISYCWDTEACSIRYAWGGDFVDNTGLWKGKPNSVAKVLGKIFFRNKNVRNIRIANREASVREFKGYQMKDRYPEFHYTIDGIDVYELIKPDAQGTGLIRTFRIPDAIENIWFYTDIEDGVIYSTTAGRMKGNILMLSPGEAREFTIMMTNTKLEI